MYHIGVIEEYNAQHVSWGSFVLRRLLRLELQLRNDPTQPFKAIMSMD